MKSIRLLTSILLFLGSALSAQKHDYHWITGYGGGEISIDQPWFGLSVLRFSDFGKLDTTNLQEPTMHMGFFNTSISDEAGRLKYYSNGVGLNNHLHQLMQNGDGMSGNPGSTGEGGGYAMMQGGVSAPWPGIPSQYILLQNKGRYFANDDDHNWKVTELLYSRIEMNANSGEGEVLEKLIPFLNDTVLWGKTTLVKHANGRDWWYLENKLDNNAFYRIQITPDGPQVDGQQSIGVPIYQGTGQAVFSPDGSKYIILNTVSNDSGGVLNIYDFDRCSGLLSNPLYIAVDNDNGTGGVAISPNNRYLYQSSDWYIYQFDLWAEDIESTRDTVAVYDLNVDWFPTTFFAAQLAPDGKIYVICPNGVPVMHRIKYPDKGGDACMVEQHSVRLPTLNAFSIPNNPNYRLGPIDGSPCDTLGIDNMPLANFRADQDSTNYLDFYFQDLSAYEPDTWQWTFGDGQMSQDTSPVHTYLEDGVYEVCLTVSNENGSHTACDTLFLGVVNTTAQLDLDVALQVFPNPFRDQFSVVMNDYYPKNAQLIVFDGLGRPIHQQRIQHGWNTVLGDAWPVGIYYYELWDKEIKLRQGKIIKQ
ncbi:PKD domain-containing protein [Lewinella cohaerens]|uniref:PKD domain-containing protein n=1 Tax=Lewinella cohaerens TaxID=70995 RepID=UPI000361CCA3|nr:PKD domain-containing protein [Lewinella cohaerens]